MPCGQSGAVGGRSALAAVILALTAAPAAADTEGPKLAVGGTLLRADGATVEAAPLTVRPVASDPDGIRSLEVTVDGRPVRALRSGVWRIDPPATATAPTGS